MKKKYKKQRIVAIVGPTASGKSDLAVFLAKKIGGEIISADSRQVYKYIHVGSNKVPGTWRPGRQVKKVFVYNGIPHHCIDFVHPKKTFTVADFKHCAKKAIAEIINRDAVPILVGGTGFYIDAVLYNTALPEVLPDKKLRTHLEKKSTKELFGMLKKLDPRRANTIDPDNPRRLIRAIEIIQNSGKIVPLFSQKPAYNALIIGIQKTERTLKQAIVKRSNEQVQNGLVEETKKLRTMGVSKKRVHEFGFEYRLTLEFLEKKLSKENLISALIKENRRYAKRQMTWFGRNKDIYWIQNKNEALRLAKLFCQ